MDHIQLMMYLLIFRNGGSTSKIKQNQGHMLY